MATINGTNGGNNLNGTNLADQIFGPRAGNDSLIGFDGDAVLEGGCRRRRAVRPAVSTGSTRHGRPTRSRGSWSHLKGRPRSSR